MASYWPLSGLPHCEAPSSLSLWRRCLPPRSSPSLAASPRSSLPASQCRRRTHICESLSVWSGGQGRKRHATCCKSCHFCMLLLRRSIHLSGPTYFFRHHVAMFVCVLLLCDSLWWDIWKVVRLKRQNTSSVTAHYSEEILQKHTLTLHRSQRHWGPQLRRVITWMITLRRTTLVVSTSSSELSEDRNPSSSAISWETAHNQHGSIYYGCLALLQHTPTHCGCSFFSLNFTFMCFSKE